MCLLSFKAKANVIKAWAISNSCSIEHVRWWATALRLVALYSGHIPTRTFTQNTFAFKCKTLDMTQHLNLFLFLVLMNVNE